MWFRPLVCLALLLSCTAIASAQTRSRETTDNPSATESIGDELREELAPGMFDQPTAPPTGSDDNKEAAPGAPGPILNFQMPGPLDHWGVHGEDIVRQSAAAPLPLVRARDGMHQAKSLLAEHDTVPRAGQVQQEVVAQLDELIAALSKQCQGGNCKPGDGPPKPSQRSQNNPGKSGSKPGRGATAARDSNDQLNNSAAKPVEKTAVEDLMKDLWGHLPERSREQILQSFSGEFLPEYELEIEKYYRRLAEEEAQNSAE